MDVAVKVGDRVRFFCPACRETHEVTLAGDSRSGWDWNGTLDHPSITPSILVNGLEVEWDENGKWTGKWPRDANGRHIPKVCHSYVTGGRIQYLGDCSHSMAGTTVDLPPVTKWPEE